MQPHWTAFVGIEHSDLHAANSADDVKAVKALYLKYKDAKDEESAEPFFSKEGGGIRRLLMKEAVQAGAVRVVAYSSRLAATSCTTEAVSMVLPSAN